MKISYNWLKEFVDHDLLPEALAERLTLSGLEVEEVERIGLSLDGVVVGEVLETRPHPNADRLTLCTVDLGDGPPAPIVCGAPNVAAGQKVPVATVGTTLLLPSRQNPTVREPVTIRETKLRGELSRGMICAEDELGLGDDHSGILVLRDDAPVGRPFAAYLKAHGVEAGDHVLDVAITPNRPDATSHLGVARDVAALEDRPLRLPDVAVPENGGAAAEQVAIEIEAPEGCPRYVGIVVRGVAAKESPVWLKRRLTAIGLRPRNVLVDVTNYVMYELGQPLHAFDLDQIAGSKIIVREAEGGEAFTTLDSKTHALPPGTLLICDAERPVALAGIMGGENSEVTETTTNVLIESAYFDPSTIRRAAKALGLSTDASYRFERGVDRMGQARAAARAAQLMAELGGGTVVSGMVDAHPIRPEPIPLRLRRSRLATILGIDVPAEETARILTALGFEVAPDGEDRFRVTVPPHRPDVEREIDLIEEVGRIYGFDRIPEPSHGALPNRTPRELPSSRLRREARLLLAGLGYREVYSNSLLPLATAERFNAPVLAGEGAVVETVNAISQEMAVLRPSLLPGVLESMRFNQNHGQAVLRFYEFGHIFQRDGGSRHIIPGYAEHESLLIATAGPDAEAGWDRQTRTVDIYDLKGVVEALLRALRVPDVSMEPAYEATPLTTHHLAIRAGDTPLGLMARLAGAVQDTYDLRTPVYFAELNWDAVVEWASPRLARRYQAVSRFPTVARDLAVVVEKGQAVGPMLMTIAEAGRPLLRHTDVFDLYEGERVGAGNKSVAFALRFGADRTLTDDEVDAAVRTIVQQLQRDFDAALRE